MTNKPCRAQNIILYNHNKTLLQEYQETGRSFIFDVIHFNLADNTNIYGNHAKSIGI